jgi:hypothetical protein
MTSRFDYYNPDCTRSLLGNGACDTVCYDSNCNFDGGGCENTQSQMTASTLKSTTAAADLPATPTSASMTATTAKSARTPAAMLLRLATACVASAACLMSVQMTLETASAARNASLLGNGKCETACLTEECHNDA